MKGGPAYIAIALIVLPLTLFAQQRDVPVNPAGTAEISGVVWSGGAASQPLRQTVVTLSGSSIPLARSVVTDQAGHFAFRRLPAGTFTVTARKAAHLPAAHGSTRPGQQGASIALSDGQRLAISMTMFKGAVIAGTVRDLAGRPIAGVQVLAVDTRSSDDTASLRSAVFTTDDRGAYRIYGLMPSEYLIAATPTAIGTGDVTSHTVSEMNAVLAALTQRQKQTSPAPPPPAEPAPAGFAPIYFPGTALSSDAGRLRVGPGDVRDGVDFAVHHVRVASIEGVVSDNVPDLAEIELSIELRGPRMPKVTAGISRRPPNAQGQFAYGNLPPGQYRVVARARSGPVETVSAPPGTVMMGGGASMPRVPAPTYIGDQLFATADVQVREQDVKGLSLVLQPGGSLAGTIAFDAASATPPADVTTIRVGLNQWRGDYKTYSGNVVSGNYLTSLPSVNVKADGTFRINGIGPASYVLSAVLPVNLRDAWKVRTAIVDGRDLLDEVIDGPSVQLTGVTLTLSNRPTDLSGTLQSASGQPASEYFVVMFSADRTQWRVGSRRNRFARPATDGRFVFADVPAGEYLLAALTDLDPTDWQEAASLEQIAGTEIRVTVAEGEQKVQNLRIR